MFVSAGSIATAAGGRFWHGRGEGAGRVGPARCVSTLRFHVASGSKSAATSADQLQISYDGCCDAADWQ